MITQVSYSIGSWLIKLPTNSLIRCYHRIQISCTHIQESPTKGFQCRIREVNEGITVAYANCRFKYRTPNCISFNNSYTESTLSRCIREHCITVFLNIRRDNQTIILFQEYIVQTWSLVLVPQFWIFTVINSFISIVPNPIRARSSTIG